LLMETSTAKVFHEIKSNQHAVFRNRDFAGTTSSMLHSITSRVVGEVNDDIRVLSYDLNLSLGQSEAAY